MIEYTSKDKNKDKKSILLVEDSPEDYEAIVRAFKKSGLDIPIYHCSDGDEALDFIFAKKEKEVEGNEILPDLIILDLNLPATGGIEVLEALKKNELYKKIPVVVLTTSAYDEDIENCYNLGVNSYVRKPVNIPDLFTAIGKLKDYWLDLSILPKEINRQ